ncbi:TPA: tRNA epoxyqueuosine(34) reductase QueG, partial [Candidatus Latescibacteria bacterium]|nr:tRNA epoxyqueuosine(34) reductase QueG [Candidatus Latescibacterota bacterium]
MDRSALTSQVKALASGLGFSPIGVTTADPPDHWSFYQDWVQKGYAGEMGYLARNLDRRADPGAIVPGARSILCLGLNYQPQAEERVPARGGRISSYARGDDYHDVIKERLLDLLGRIQSLAPGTEGRAYVDTGPVLEREYAARAGLG